MEEAKGEGVGNARVCVWGDRIEKLEQVAGEGFAEDIFK